jgi:Putative auto-transporter adhesin, head GIN domain
MRRNFTQKKLHNLASQNESAVAQRWATAFFMGVMLLIGFAAIAPAHAATRNFGVTGFDSIVLQAPYQVTVQLGSSAGAIAEGAPEALESIIMEVNDGVLTIRGKPRDPKAQRRSTSPIRLTIRAPMRLKSITVIGFGSLSVAGLSAPNLSLILTGAGSIIADIKRSDAVDIALSGDGTMALRGTARSLNASLSGNGQINADGLIIRQAIISQSGAGAGRYQVSEFATISAQGLGTLDIAGRGHCRIKQDGGTNIRCAGRIVPAR